MRIFDSSSAVIPTTLWNAIIESSKKAPRRRTLDGDDDLTNLIKLGLVDMMIEGGKALYRVCRR